MAAVGFVAGLLIASVTTGIAEVATGYRLTTSGPLPVAVTVADLVGLWVGLIGAVVYASRRAGRGRLDDDYGLRVGAWWDLPLGIAVGVASQYGLVPLIYLPLEQIDRGLVRQLGKPALRETAAAHTNAAVAVLFIFLALGAPVVEELFFRGLLLRSLLGLANPAISIVVTGVLFALAHFEAAQFAGLAAFGIVLGVMAWLTGRLAPSIGAHMAFNAVAVLTIVRTH